MWNCIEGLALQLFFFKHGTLISLYSASEQAGLEKIGLKESSKPQRKKETTVIIIPDVVV